MSFLKSNLFKIILLTLLLALSLVYNHNPDFWISKQYEYYQLFLVLIFSAILFSTSKNQLVLGKADIAVIVILLFLALSRSLHLGSLNEIHVTNTFALIVYYISLKTISLKKEEFTIYYHSVILIGLFLSGYCILELYNVMEPTSLYWKMKGNFPNPGPLGGFIALILSLVFYELSKRIILKKCLKSAGYLIIASTMTFILIKSESRAAMLSAVIAITVLTGYYGFKKWKYFKYALFSLIPVFIFIVLSKGTDSINGRLLIWKISFLSFFKNPYTGIGYGFFGVEYPNFQADYFRNGGTNQEILLAGATEQTFNEFLKFVIENGILGIILIAGGIYWILKSNDKDSIQTKQDSSLASLAFYGSIIVFSSFSFPLQFLPFKLLLINQIALQDYTKLSQSFEINKKFEKLVFGAMSCCMVFISNYQYKGFKAWKEASELQFSHPDTAQTLYSDAYQRLNNDGSFLLHYGFFMEDKNKKTALTLFEKAKQLNNFPALYHKTAQLNEQLGNYKSAEQNFLKLHFISPHLFKPQEELLDFYTRRSDATKAKYYAVKILETPIKIPSQEVLRIKQKAKIFLTQI